MEKTVISTNNAPGAIGPYSQGWVVGDFVYTSGQIPVNPANGEVPAGIAAQAEQSCKNVAAILEAAGMTMNDVVKTTVLLSDIANFGEMNKVYAEFFEAPFPARAAFQVAALPKAALVEIEAIAAK